MIILAVLIIGGGWFGLSKYNYAKHHEDTDDAQVSGDITSVSPRISGYVKEVRVKDNQLVKKGDTLLIIDDRDYRIKLEEAQAALQTAQSNLGTARASTSASHANIATSAASIGTINAQIEASRITLRRAEQDYERYANLIKDHSITQQQFEQAQAARDAARQQIQILEEQRRQAASQTNAVSEQSAATGSQINVAASAIRQREVDVKAAELNISYTVLTAPEDGMIDKVTVQPGQLLQTGQSLFGIVHLNHIWVTANFKETQLEKMRLGQKVEVVADAYKGHTFEGTVSSFAPLTGSQRSILPPDNASGNFVKTVQRVPVRIDFASMNDSLLRALRPGMNVNVDVHLD